MGNSKLQWECRENIPKTLAEPENARLLSFGTWTLTLGDLIAEKARNETERAIEAILEIYHTELRRKAVPTTVQRSSRELLSGGTRHRKTVASRQISVTPPSRETLGTIRNLRFNLLSLLHLPEKPPHAEPHDPAATMLYELIAVVRRPLPNPNCQTNLSQVRGQSLQEVKECAPPPPPHTKLTPNSIAKSAGLLVLRNGGVVRGFTNWERLLLPKRTLAHQTFHTHGQYFVMRFDSNAITQAEIKRTLGLDPRMINFSVVKLGKKLEEVAEVGGQTFSMKPV